MVHGLWTFEEEIKMETILYNIGQVLGITIIHSLWQGLLIYFTLRIVFMAVPALSSVKKYNLAIGAMVSIFVCFVYTLYIEVDAYNWVNFKPVNTLPLLPYITLPINSRHFIADEFSYSAIANYLPYISALYIAGLSANLLKLGREWNRIRLIKRSLIPAGQMQQYINTFSKKLNITKYIQLKFSDLIDVPCMIGYFKPIILLPIAIASNLSACEIEAILLHELSHIKRNDYVINLVQQVITIILFFNPFAQLINRIVNQERENSCDDLVIEKTGNPLIYAKALLKLEETRKSNLQFALSATGKRYHLLNRIERIMETKKPIGNTRHLLVAVLLLAGSLGSIAWLSPKAVAANTKAAHNHKAVAKLKSLDGLNSYNSLPAIETDSTRNILIGDTIKHHHKGKITVISKNGHKRVYDSDLDSAAMDSIDNFYSSAEWRKQMEDIRKQGEQMKKQFNSPQWRAQMLAMRKQTEEMAKQFNSPAWKKSMEDMKIQGEEMRKKFDSPEWKKSMEDMKIQGEEMAKKFNNPEWKKSMEDMKIQGEEMRKKFNSPEWKKSMEDMKIQGEEMAKKFNSREWKKSMEDMKIQGEEMQKQFNSPEWKKNMEDIQKQGEELRKQFNSPAWKNLKDMKWELKDSVNQIYKEAPEEPKKKN